MSAPTDTCKERLGKGYLSFPARGLRFLRRAGHGHRSLRRIDRLPPVRWLGSGLVAHQAPASTDAGNRNTPAGTRRTREVNESKEKPMALRGASQVGEQDWISWEALAAENAAVVCSVKEIEPPKDFGNGPICPVRARVIVLTGSQAGKVYDDERILKAGIRSRLTQVGDDVVGRLGTYGKRGHVGLNAEHPGDIELAERALAKVNASSASNGATNGANNSASNGTTNGAVRAQAQAQVNDVPPPF